MFGIFKKKNPEDALYKRYNQLMKEWKKLSTTNRRASDEKYKAAQLVLQEIEALKNKD